MDTAALLEGNEYLIKQMLDEIEQIKYNEKELGVLKWALTEVIWILIPMGSCIILYRKCVHLL